MAVGRGRDVSHSGGRASGLLIAGQHIGGSHASNLRGRPALGAGLSLWGGDLRDQRRCAQLLRRGDDAIRMNMGLTGRDRVRPSMFGARGAKPRVRARDSAVSQVRELVMYPSVIYG